MRSPHSGTSSPPSSPDSLFDSPSPSPRHSPTPESPPLVYRHPPVAVSGLHLSPTPLPEELRSSLLASITEHCTFSPTEGITQCMFFNLPPFLDSLAAHLRTHLAAELPPSAIEALFDQPHPRQSILNAYVPGQGLHPHTDLARFDEGVLLVSLGSGIPMRFAPVDPERQAEAFELWLEDRSVLALWGEARWEWTHGIVGREEDVVEGYGRRLRGMRVGVTLRWLRDGNEVAQSAST